MLRLMWVLLFLPFFSRSLWLLLYRSRSQQGSRGEQVAVLLRNAPAYSYAFDRLGVEDEEGAPELAVLPTEGGREIDVETVVDDDDLGFLRVGRVRPD